MSAGNDKMYQVQFWLGLCPRPGKFGGQELKGKRGKKGSLE